MAFPEQDVSASRFEEQLPWAIPVMVFAILVVAAFRPLFTTWGSERAFAAKPGVVSVVDAEAESAKEKVVIVSEEATKEELTEIAATMPYDHEVQSKNFRADPHVRAIPWPVPSPELVADWIVATRGLPLEGSIGYTVDLRFEDGVSLADATAAMRSLETADPPGREIKASFAGNTVRVFPSSPLSAEALELIWQHAPGFDELEVVFGGDHGEPSIVRGQGGDIESWRTLVEGLQSTEGIKWDEMSWSMDDVQLELLGDNGKPGAVGTLSSLHEQFGVRRMTADCKTVHVASRVVLDDPAFIDALPTETQTVRYQREGSRQSVEIPADGSSLAVTRKLLDADVMPQWLAPDWLVLDAEEGISTEVVAEATTELGSPLTIALADNAIRLEPDGAAVPLTSPLEGPLTELLDDGTNDGA